MARRILRVFFSSHFERSFKHLPLRIQKLARKKDKIFRRNPFHPSLETHKLGGKLKGDLAYSVNRDYRVHFYFVDDETVMYANIGTHEIYKK